MDDESGTRTTRWAGVPADERTRDRRALLIEVTFDLFGTEGDVATSIRAICRAAELNARYFYESFTDRDDLLAAVYDREAAKLAEQLGAALDRSASDPATNARAGIGTVLRFITDDPRRARILFTEGRANPALAERRRTAVRALVDGIAEAGRQELGHDRPGSVADVAATLFGGAMEELAQAWIDDRLGSDLDQVVDTATALSLAIFDKARGA